MKIRIVKKSIVINNNNKEIETYYIVQYRNFLLWWNIADEINYNPYFKIYIPSRISSIEKAVEYRNIFIDYVNKQRECKKKKSVVDEMEF